MTRRRPRSTGPRPGGLPSLRRAGGARAEPGLRAVSLFSGVEGLGLGLELAGIQTVAQCELDPACREVLERHWPGLHRFTDIREVTHASTAPLGAVDLVHGGFPCQGLSVAGRRQGLADQRSGLWWQFWRVLAELRPRWVVVENVPGLLSAVCPDPDAAPTPTPTPAPFDADGFDLEHPDGPATPTGPGACPGGCMAAHGGAMGLVLGSLAELGYGYAYRVLDARHFGLAQRRRRVFIVGCLGDRTAPCRVLLEPDRGRRDPAPREPAPPRAAARAGRRAAGAGGQGVAATLGVPTPRGGPRTDVDRMTFVPYADPLTAGGPTAGRRQHDDWNLVGHRATPHGPAAHQQPADQPGTAPAPDRDGGATARQCGTGIAHTLTGDGFDASEDGTGRGVPLVAHALQAAHALDADPDASGAPTTTIIAHALTGREAKGPSSDLNSGTIVPIDLRNAARSTGRGAGTQGDGLGEGGDPAFAVTATTRARPAVFRKAQEAHHDTDAERWAPAELAATLDATGMGGRTAHAVVEDVSVRRLTPLECERLQGFPDGWTDGQADGPRYRQLGNAVAVPVAAWIGRRILAHDRGGLAREPTWHGAPSPGRPGREAAR